MVIIPPLPGVYPARASGYETEFKIDRVILRAKSATTGIRGINFPDKVTVFRDGSMQSQVLGSVSLVDPETENCK